MPSGLGPLGLPKTSQTLAAGAVQVPWRPTPWRRLGSASGLKGLAALSTGVGACFLQKDPQVAAKPQGRPSRVRAAQSTLASTFLPGGGGIGMGGPVSRTVLCRLSLHFCRAALY